ncbi:type II toxin -antitoxin system TacA 1-like antitoxin [Burkholderia glumae]
MAGHHLSRVLNAKNTGIAPVRGQLTKNVPEVQESAASEGAAQPEQTTFCIVRSAAGAQLRYICGTSFSGGLLMERKSDTLNLRVTPELKELIRLAAEREHRTIANFIEVLVRQHCVTHGVDLAAKRPKSN